MNLYDDELEIVLMTLRYFRSDAHSTSDTATGICCRRVIAEIDAVIERIVEHKQDQNDQANDGR